jgi:hypothetical protein
LAGSAGMRWVRINKRRLTPIRRGGIRASLLSV